MKALLESRLKSLHEPKKHEVELKGWRPESFGILSDKEKEKYSFAARVHKYTQAN